MRHLDNSKSVQAQLDEIRQLKEKLSILEGELKTFMEENDKDVLNGITTCYTRTWVKDTLIFNSTAFKKDHMDLYEKYKTQEKAGGYRYKENVIK